MWPDQVSNPGPLVLENVACSQFQSYTRNGLALLTMFPTNTEIRHWNLRFRVSKFKDLR